MKKLYIAILAFFLAFTAQSQVINFTNVNLKQRLLQASPNAGSQYAKDINGNYVKIDTNSNGQIEVAEALNIYWLNVGSCNTDNLVGIENFTNLKTFHCSSNPLLMSFGTVLDVMPLLEHLIFTNSQIGYFNSALHPGLLSLTANDNLNLTSIDLTPLHSLQALYLQNDSNLLTVDTSNCPNLIQVWLGYCTNLQSLNIKNGVDDSSYYDFSGCSNLRYICCDEVEYAVTSGHGIDWGARGCLVNTYCTITPGGVFYVINGSEKADVDNNGCGPSDPFYRNLKFTLSSTTTYETYFGDATGHHNFWVGPGTYTLTPIIENPTYYTVSPSSANVTFPTQTSPATKNFCILPNGIHPDLEVILIPLKSARPGFDCPYRIIYKNNGNIMQSGSVNLTFNASILTFQSSTPVASSQSGNTISWNFTNLLPLEAREQTVILKLNSPVQSPPVNSGNVLTYTCSVVSPAIDDTPANNTAVLSQIVVNSFDPNDKRCLEGTTISTTQIGDYVHYIIRFENTGTYPAENIIVTDDINSTKFVIGSLIPLSGSHPFITRIVGSKVEFLFENINLPFDDANNDGYIAFKVKTKSTLVVGDSFTNKASIYFDYNAPIITNTASTSIQALGTPDFDFGSAFRLSPVPTKSSLTITAKKQIEISSVSIYNMLGQLVQAITDPGENIDVSGLKTGNYFIKIFTDKGSATAKFIKE